MSTDATKTSKKKKPFRRSGRPGGRRETRAPERVTGVLLVDKPAGLTSFAVVERVRELLGVQRVGHCGTLDPMATGLLVILIGEATKVAQYLTDEDKVYEGQIRLGVDTDTDDADGQTIATKDASHVTLEAARAAAKRFSGEFLQKPPRFSAQKRQGVRAYERARAGEDFEPEARQVTVHSLELLSLEGGFLDFRCRVGKGTYVRSLARDIGAALEVGAHVANLRRTHSGGFGLEKAVTLDALAAEPIEERLARVRPLSAAWRPRPVVAVSAHDIERLRRGQQIAVLKEAVEELAPGRQIALAIDEHKRPVAAGKLEWDRVSRTFVMSPERNLFAGAESTAGGGADSKNE